MAKVELRGVKKSFGHVEVLAQIDLVIDDGEFCVIVGPSGCGKSTILRLIAGLEEVTAGSVSIGGRDVTRQVPSRRGVAMVFQSYALYPHMTVAQNITFGLKTLRTERSEVAHRLTAAAHMLKLDDLLDRKPRQLSGGQRQRVAIGRAVVREPKVFLFDEPLSNLDAALRTQMRIELDALHRKLRSTMIYVTHDQIEAMTMADKIVVLNEGHIEQTGAPLDIYDKPANLFVAGFIGSPRMNFIRCKVAGRKNGKLQVKLPRAGEIGMMLRHDPPETGSEVVLGIRPEHLLLGEPGEAGISGKASLVERLGAETVIHVDAELAEPIVLRREGLVDIATDARVELGLASRRCHLFSLRGPRFS
jgi:multiple sugar transport system ATP-binding protein